MIRAGICRDQLAPRHQPRDGPLPSHRGLHRPELEQSGQADPRGEHPATLLCYSKPMREHEASPEVRGQPGGGEQQREDAA